MGPDYDASALWRQQKAADEADVVATLAGPNPHAAELDLPPALLEDGGSY